MDLIRELLLKLETLNLKPGVTRSISPSAPELAVDNVTVCSVEHHLHMLVSGNLIETGTPPFNGNGSLAFRQLSWAGRDFLDTVRDPEIWKKTKKGAVAAGGFTIDLLRDLAKGLVKKQIEDYTGIKL